MVLRSVIGALVAVGVMGVVAAALPERHPGKPPAPAPAPTFGALNAAAPAQGAAQTGGNDDQKNLLKLAAYPGPAAVAPTRMAATAGPATTPAPPPPSAAPAPPSVLSPAPTPVKIVAITPPAAAQAAAVVPPAASVDPVPAAPSDRSAGRININRASIAELDHIPGAGRIGASIARRRPYGSIDDLVRKRVLREAAFQRIRSAITTD